MRRASQTAEFMALFRALETIRAPADERLFDDPDAAKFLRPALRAVVSAAQMKPIHRAVETLIERRWPGALSSGIARTRLIDDLLGDAQGVRQVVVLGAGFDMRAARLRPLRSATVFELDRPETLARKATLLGTARAPNVRRVPIDFDSQSFEAVVMAAGFSRDQPCAFVWEGVTNYLSASAVDATMRAIARAAS
jgi:methyltransferase (TIGR00027 family)